MVVMDDVNFSLLELMNSTNSSCSKKMSLHGTFQIWSAHSDSSRCACCFERASWFYKVVPLVKNWYKQWKNKTTLQMKQVVAANLFMEPISIVNNLPNTCNNPKARGLGAKHVSDDSWQHHCSSCPFGLWQMPDKKSDRSSDSHSITADSDAESNTAESKK